MKTFARFALTLVAAGLLAGTVGCQEKQPEPVSYSPPQDNAAADRIAQLEAELNQAMADRQRSQQEIDRLRADLQALRDQLDRARQQPPAPAGWQNIPGGAMTSIEGTLLFDSGKAALRPGANRTIDAVAATINQQYPNHDIYVFGHTDSDPIRYSKWADNYELSCERALSVVRVLRRGGVSNPMAACGWGENKPTADNTSAASKQANRRVEIYAMNPQDSMRTPSATNGPRGMAR